MQNKYVGDEGDFVKYGLLRRLTCPKFTNSPLSLGVIWYLFDDENNQDGKKLATSKTRKIGNAMLIFLILFKKSSMASVMCR